MDDFPINLLTGMVEIYSPSGEEEQVSRFLAEKMTERGFRVTRDLAGNVIGTIGSGRPHILLCGHMDTVASMLPMKLQNGVIYGRGSVDAKAALAAMVEAAAEIASELHGTITVAGVTDEEGKNKGIRTLILEGADYNYAIFGEPTNVETITVGYKGNLTYQLTCVTDSGHSSAPWMFENSIEKVYEIWKELEKLCTLPVNGAYFQTITACIRRIEGGQHNNIVPSRCVIEVDTRLPPGVTVDEMESRIKDVILDYNIRRSRVSVEYLRIDQSEAYLSSSHNAVTRALSSAIYSVRKTQPRLVTKTGTGDMNIFGNQTGIPTVTYGPGDSQYDHRVDEQIKISDYFDSIKILIKALRYLQATYGK